MRIIAPAPEREAWVPPTLVIGDTERLATEEVFGPVATLVATDGLEDHRRGRRLVSIRTRLRDLRSGRRRPQIDDQRRGDQRGRPE
jgi:hypothetical protein